MERRTQDYQTDAASHDLEACARDRWLRRLAEDAIGEAELRWLRAGIVAAAADSPRARLRRWLAEGRA